MLEQEDTVEKKYFTIGEVAKELNVSASLIRFWEKEFPKLNPRKTQGGTRKFSKEDVLLLKQIYQLVKIEGFTLPGAKEKLKEKNNTPVSVDEIKIKLQDIRKFLLELKNNIH